MDNKLLILVALCWAELLHNIMEVWGIKQKVRWLDTVQNGSNHGRWPMNVNTKIKALLFHIVILVIFCGFFLFILKIMNLSERSLIVMGIVVLLANYANTTWQVDSYHAQIGKLITRAKKAK